MRINYDVQGQERKRLVKVISDTTGAQAVYKFMPTCAYEIDYFTVTKEGELVFDDRADSEEVEAVLEAIAAAGFTPAESSEEAATEPDKAPESETEEAVSLTVSVPAAAHTGATLRNLVNIVNAKEDLLTQALAIDPERRTCWCRPVDQVFLTRMNLTKPQTMEALAKLWYDSSNWQWHASQHYDGSRYRLLNLHAVWQKGTIEFRAFNSTLHAGEVKSYIQLCLAISHKALTAKSASPTRPQTDNPKYTFRCWLLQLGFIGDEFETARQHLTKHLPGNSAWRQAS